MAPRSLCLKSSVGYPMDIPKPSKTRKVVEGLNVYIYFLWISKNPPKLGRFKVPHSRLCAIWDASARAVGCKDPTIRIFTDFAEESHRDRPKHWKAKCLKFIPKPINHKVNQTNTTPRLLYLFFHFNRLQHKLTTVNWGNFRHRG